MHKVQILVSSCKSGDILAQDVYDNNGTLYIADNTEITPFIIKKLKEFNIKSIYIYEREEEPVVVSPYEISYRKFNATYNNSVGQIKSVMADLAAGKSPEPEVLENIVDSLFDEIDQKSCIIQRLSEMRSFDQYTYSHCINVALYTMLTAKWLKLPNETVKASVMSGLLHDIGKALIPPAVLNKRGKLDDGEFAEVMKHPLYGCDIANSIPGVTDEILQGILMHHERYDGKGYPFGVKGEEIGVFARIIAVADVYDALTSERAYKKRITPFDTFHFFEVNGIGHFDIEIMMTFLRNIASYYIGAEVVVNTGNRGQVIHVQPRSISRPIIRIGNSYIDLSTNKDIRIVEMTG